MAKRFRLGLNGRVLAGGRLDAAARHTVSLIRALGTLENPPEIHLFTDQEIPSAHLSSLGGCRIHQSRVWPHLAWEQASLAVEVAARRIDLFHSTWITGVPALLPIDLPKVITVHDTSAIDRWRKSLPGTLGELKKRMSRELSWYAARTADAFITVSHHAAEQLVGHYPRLAGKVHVIPNGVEPRFSPGETDATVLEKHGLDKPYFLHVGSFGVRKDIAFLFKAFRAFSKQTNNPAMLALAGDYTHAPARLRQEALAIPGVRWLGYVGDDELVQLYRGAKAVLVPSQAEGFGLQILEGMACGTPVFSGRSASLPEVGGDAAQYFDSDEPQVLAALLKRALQQPLWLESLSKQGLQWVARFSWRQSAEKTLSVYRTLRPDLFGAPH